MVVSGSLLSRDAMFFELVPNFLLKMHFLEIGIFIFIFSQISVYIPLLKNYSRYLDGPL